MNETTWKPIVITAALLCSSLALAQETTKPPAKLGMNLAGFSDRETRLSFSRFIQIHSGLDFAEKGSGLGTRPNARTRRTRLG